MYGSVLALKALRSRFFAVYTADSTYHWLFFSEESLFYVQSPNRLRISKTLMTQTEDHCRWSDNQGNHSEQNDCSASKLQLTRWYL